MQSKRRLGCERLEERTAMAVNAFDPSFGTAGRVQTDLDSFSSDKATVSALQPDGKILVAGTSNNNFAIARYTDAGVLDPTFSFDGKVFLSAGVNTHPASLRAIAVQTDGKIVLAGGVFLPNSQDVVIIRLLPNGLLDTSFSEDGFQTTELGSNVDEATAIAIQPDGKLLVAANYNMYFSRAHLLRYLSNGQLDTSFSGDGISTMATNGAFIRDIALQPDGRILAGGHLQSGPNQGLLLTRFKANGALDGTFGQNAKVVSNGPLGVAQKVKLLPDGRFYVAGSNMIVQRYFANGQIDNSLATPGNLVNLPSDFGDVPSSAGLTSMVVRPDGGFALLGVIQVGTTLRSYFMQLTASGRLDEGFAGDGDWSVWTESVGRLELNNILLRSDGRIVLTGFTSAQGANQFDFVAYRFLTASVPNVTSALTVNSAGQIELFDHWGHDDRWQFSRTATDIVITDLTEDPRLVFTVSNLPDVSGGGTKTLHIPLALLLSNGKPLIVSGREGDDTFSFENEFFDAPLAGISFRGGNGVNTLSLANYDLPVSWLMSGPNSGSARPQGRVPMSFSTIARLEGGLQNDYVRLLYQASDQLLAIDGGIGGNDTIELRADQDMASEYFPWPQNIDRFRVGTTIPQYYSIRNFERAVLFGGASNNQIHVPALGSNRTVVYAGSGNDNVSVGGHATIFGENGDDELHSGEDSSILRGGEGNDILVGSYGADQLYGDAGRDILVGGMYTDLLVGGADDDIVIGGFCPLIEAPANPALRDAIVTTWNSNLDYAARVQALSRTGVGPARSIRLTLNTTVTNDLWFVDTLYGNDGQDWYFLSPEYEIGVDSGGLRDRQTGEVINNG